MKFVTEIDSRAFPAMFDTIGQAINPYSYVINNPLSLTDPSGYKFLGGIGHFLKKVFKFVVHKIVLFVEAAASAFICRGEPPKYSTINARIETVKTAVGGRVRFVCFNVR